MEKKPIDLNSPHQSPREQEGNAPNMLEQKPGQPSAFAGMDTGATADGPEPARHDRNTIDPATGLPHTDTRYEQPEKPGL